MIGISGPDLGYAIIGCGWVSDAHGVAVRALAKEGVHLIAVADQDKSRADNFAKRYGVDFSTDDYREILSRSEVDVVSICLPDFLHEEVTVEAAKRGKHVLCEKPLSLNLETAENMVRSCLDVGVNLGIVFNHRYSPDNIRVRGAVEDGALGSMLLGSVIHSSSLTGNVGLTSAWRGIKGRSTGGVLASQAIHFLDLLLWFMGPVASVSARTATLARTSRDYEDVAVLTLQFRSGALATLATTNGSPIVDDLSGTRIDMQGTNGYVLLEGGRLKGSHFSTGYELKNVILPTISAEASGSIFGDGHIYEIADFIGAIRRGEDAPIPGVDGLHLMGVLAAAYESATIGGEIEIPIRLSGYEGVTSSHSLLKAAS